MQINCSYVIIYIDLCNYYIYGCVMELHTYLHKNNTTAKQFAKILGVGECTVSAWRTRKRKPTKKTYALILAATKGQVTEVDFVYK